MPFRAIYPWLARALSPGCCLHVLEPCNVSFWGDKKKEKTEDFLVLLIGMRVREREERKKERKQTHAWTSLVAFFWRSPFMVSSQI